MHIGDLPIMVKSKKCNLYKENLEEEREISEEEYWRMLHQKGEDPMDPGGYFIIGGTERVLITLEDLAPNRVMVEYQRALWHRARGRQGFLPEGRSSGPHPCREEDATAC